MPTVLGHGAYTFAEAAKLTGFKRFRVWEWFRGRGTGRTRKAVFHGDYEPVHGEYAISFHDLIDLFVAGQLREHGVSLQTVRRSYKAMAQELNTRHPFCRREVLTDGKTVFMFGQDPEGQEELREVLTKQKVFPQVLLPFLQRIDYDQVTILAKRWRIADMVVVDPAICFGKPIVEKVGIPTAVLAACYHANKEDAELVADCYNVHRDHVLAAVRFEGSMAA
jgi:uncharacterized protein (DUF433 family)